MKRNGFTLIELLAVIVILAIIALIATPIILGIINDAREKANERSVELYAAAVKNGIAAYQLTGLNAPKSFSDLTIQYDGDVKCTVQELYEDGSFYLEGCKVNNGDKEYSYGTKQEKVVYLSDVCDPVSVKTEGKYTAGDKYTCTVDPSKPAYTFYVLTSATSGSVNLIMDSNITRTGDAIKEAKPTDKGLVAWITKEDYIREDIGGIEADYGDDGNWNKGPITAIEYLQDATAGWTKTNPQTISTFNDENGDTYPMGKTYTVNARMPYYSELSNYNHEDGSNAYLYDYLRSKYNIQTNGVYDVDGYWTLTSDTGKSRYAKHALNEGWIDVSDVSNDDSCGVRPVINLSI